MNSAKQLEKGFTLVELSIVLVIGLLVGGVLVGRNLMAAAAIRAQISQIEKYQQAVNAFRGKYEYLPGDIVPDLVRRFGFTASPTRGGTGGRGDGNGELDGESGGTVFAWNQNGENLFFWEDLSANSGLIEGSFASVPDGTDTYCNSLTACSRYLPAAKLGGNSSVYTYSGYASGACCPKSGFGPNFFGLSQISNITTSNASVTKETITVAQAWSIDGKIDDGLPQSGNVRAQFLTTVGSSSGVVGWASSASLPNSATCFDTTSDNYSISQNNGTGVNCALSFKFQ